MGAERRAMRFASQDSSCAAWYYPGDNGACVVMAGGAGVVKEPGTDRFARRFNDAGFAVLAFDFRGQGESGGGPRGVIRIPDQLDDWSAAIRFAGSLDGVDASRLAVWGFSLAGGEVLSVAVRHPELAAVIAQTPLVDGRAAAISALRHSTAWSSGGLIAAALVDALGSIVGRAPRMVPTSGPRGTVALLTTPDATDATRALDPGGRYPDWSQEVAARFALRVGMFRPARDVERVASPLLVVVGDEDLSTAPRVAVGAARRAPRGEVLRLPGGHYAPFLESHEPAVSAEIEFLRAHLAPHATGGALDANPHADRTRTRGRAAAPGA